MLTHSRTSWKAAGPRPSSTRTRSAPLALSRTSRLSLAPFWHTHTLGSSRPLAHFETLTRSVLAHAHARLLSPSRALRDSHSFRSGTRTRSAPLALSRTSRLSLAPFWHTHTLGSSRPLAHFETLTRSVLPGKRSLCRPHSIAHAHQSVHYADFHHAAMPLRLPLFLDSLRVRDAGFLASDSRCPVPSLHYSDGPSASLVATRALHPTRTRSTRNLTF
jgi:hypothetical protein